MFFHHTMYGQIHNYAYSLFRNPESAPDFHQATGAIKPDAEHAAVLQTQMERFPEFKVPGAVLGTHPE